MLFQVHSVNETFFLFRNSNPENTYSLSIGRILKYIIVTKVASEVETPVLESLFNKAEVLSRENCEIFKGYLH